MTLKEQQQQDKRQRLVVKGTINRLLQKYSLKQIKTWEDAYILTGHDANYSKSQPNSQQPLTYPELKSYTVKYEHDFEKGLKRKYEVQQEDQQVTPEMVRQVDKGTSEIVVGNDKQVEQTIQKEVEVRVDESGFNNSNDYGLVPSPKEKAFLFWFQKKAVKEACDKIINESKRGILILASTGTGKTYMQGALDRRLQDIKFADSKTWGHIKYLAITRNSVVEQTKRVLKEKFEINPITETEVINIEKLRTRAGQIWIDNKTVVQDGEEVELWEWKDLIYPAVIYLDECQSIKNADSTQHKIMLAYSRLPINTVQVFISATPFTRVSEAKAFAVATKKDIFMYTGIPGSILSEDTWPTYAAAIAHPTLPEEYNEAAVERLMKDLDDYVVRVKGVRWQFNAVNSVEIIDFENDQQRKEYNDAWEKYLAKKAKLEESVTDNPRFQAMIELGIFLAAAEYAKRYIFAKRMYEDVQNGYAAVCAIKFKKTIIAVTQILVNDYGVSRDQISLVWGGGQTQLTAKQKLKAQVRAAEDMFNQAGITMADMMLDDVEDRVLEDIPKELRLGMQSKEQRQIEIDRFQSGKSLYCMYTYKAGGVGLSLHHTDEMTKEKVRRQKNGYAVVEDIPNIPTRPRMVTVGPTWSPIELVQGCGRAPRLTSLSNTIQKFLYFRGTVEEDQAFVVTHRLKCLSKVVRQHENWMDLIDKHEQSKAIAQARVEETKQYESEDPQTDINLGEEGDD